eukprot:scaffold7777_cov471-Prasinococcus_capsulatus_cf.AAC.1
MSRLPSLSTDRAPPSLPPAGLGLLPRTSKLSIRLAAASVMRRSVAGELARLSNTVNESALSLTRPALRTPLCSGTGRVPVVLLLPLFRVRRAPRDLTGVSIMGKSGLAAPAHRAGDAGRAA